MFLLFSLAVAAHAHDSPRVGRSLLYSLVSTLDNIDFFFLGLQHNVSSLWFTAPVTNFRWVYSNFLFHWHSVMFKPLNNIKLHNLSVI